MNRFREKLSNCLYLSKRLSLLRNVVSLMQLFLKSCLMISSENFLMIHVCFIPHNIRINLIMAKLFAAKRRSRNFLFSNFQFFSRLGNSHSSWQQLAAYTRFAIRWLRGYRTSSVVLGTGKSRSEQDKRVRKSPSICWFASVGWSVSQWAGSLSASQSNTIAQRQRINYRSEF